MSAFLDDEERENLESLKQDLVGPLKRFTQEVREDTVGDAKRFYVAQARRAAQNAKLAQQKTAEKMARLRQEQEQLQRRRKQLMKRAAITLALLALLSAVILSLALYAHAGTPERPCPEIEYITETPPEFGSIPSRTGEPE
jgi:type VI protein secretion system component VasF